MKNRFRFTILLLLSCLLLSQGTMTAFAETEGSAESEVNTTQSQELSMDDTLSSLKIAQATLHPEFSPNQLTYTATVPYEVERVALTAQTNSPEARKVIRGTSDLKVGENLITVTVTAENGFVREYRITLIRREMPETTTGEDGETQETPAVNESDSQDETSEMDPEESSAEESQEMTPEETTPQETTPEETVIVPQETKPNGGMMIETTEDAPWDLNSLLTNPMLLIGLIGAIVLVVLIIVIVGVIALFSRGKEKGDDDDEADEEDDEWEHVDGDHEESSESVVDAVMEKDEVSSGYDGETRSESAVAQTADDDLDDDFEMLLEDDDDFDFLDF